MSQTSQLRSHGDGAIIVAAFSAGGWRFDLHRHEENQLAWASSGILTVVSATKTWVLPSSRALWIPAGTEHVTEAGRNTTLCSPYFEEGRGPYRPEPAVMAISALSRELILHLAGGEITRAARQRAESVLLDQLDEVPVTTVGVPMPDDPRALDVARQVIDDPADGATLTMWARRTGTSARTLTRLFPAETGMTFGHWRTRVRLRASLPLLAEGLPVAVVARQVGYVTPSAFVAVFRKVTGRSPGAYFTR